LVDEDTGPTDIVVHSRHGQLKRVSELHHAYDPLQYLLMIVTEGHCNYVTIAQQNFARNRTV